MSNDCSYNELYPLQVLDDSMEPEFPEKCIIVVEPSEVCATGAYVVADVNGERWFRQYLSEGEKGKRLVALKEEYPAIDLDDAVGAERRDRRRRANSAGRWRQGQGQDNARCHQQAKNRRPYCS